MVKPPDTLRVIGLMSGTSLDGLDMACCVFTYKKGGWSYQIEKAQTISYQAAWKNKLKSAHKLSASALYALDAEFGEFMGQQALAFIKRNNLKKIQLISSHGHTVFHQPDKGFTCQIGSGAVLASVTGIATASDFRSGDVALGGQGAPLVPVGDELLFGEYNACLNLGGIGNISFKRNGKRLAFDISAANMVLNYLAQQKGFTYDKDGHMARSGQVHWSLLKKLNAHPFYTGYKSKSLGREWVEEYVLPLFDKEKISVNDKLATAAEHTAMQTARVLNHFKIKRVLITGGGAYNSDLISRLAAYSNAELVIPDSNTIQFKEALIFAFLGVLRLRGEVNCLKEVTGAKRDSVGGALYSGIQ